MTNEIKDKKLEDQKNFSTDLDPGYPAPVYEDGGPCLDMGYLKKEPKQESESEEVPGEKKAETGAASRAEGEKASVAPVLGVGALGQCFFCFALYSFLGWIYEVTLALLYGEGFVNRGFLFGPYLPVYGVGALLLVVLLGQVMEKKRYLGRIPVTPVVVFLLVILITTVLEYITGSLLWVAFEERWWDYSADFLNLNGYICALASIRFGFGGLFFLYVCQPVFEKLYKRLPKKIGIVLLWTLGTAMLIDFMFSLMRNLI